MLEVQDVLQAYRKVGIRNPYVVSLFFYDLSLEINLKVKLMKIIEYLFNIQARALGCITSI